MPPEVSNHSFHDAVTLRTQAQQFQPWNPHDIIAYVSEQSLHIIQRSVTLSAPKRPRDSITKPFPASDNCNQQQVSQTGDKVQLTIHDAVKQLTKQEMEKYITDTVAIQLAPIRQQMSQQNNEIAQIQSNIDNFAHSHQSSIDSLNKDFSKKIDNVAKSMSNSINSQLQNYQQTNARTTAQTEANV